MKKQYGVYEEFYQSNTCGCMQVLEKIGKKFKVRFLETGYETIAEIGNVLAGKVLDPVYKQNKLNTWVPFEEYYTNNAGQKLKVFAKMRNKYKVQFEETGYTVEAFIVNVKAGKVTDPYAKSFLGIGYLGEFELKPYWKQAKQLWSNMMKRCYNPKDDKGYYGKCFVDVRWQCFANFLEDLPKLENFELWLLGYTDGQVKYNLDKDLKVPGNKVYSREMCMFETEYLNKSTGAINARLLDKLKKGEVVV